MGEQDVVKEISSLVEERRRFEQWIVALDARRATTPPHVFDRVRADYQARLEGVLAKLGDFMPRLRELESGLVARLEEANGAIREVDDHRAESELRAHVGELSAEAWERVQEEAASRLATLGDDLQGIERELANVRELMTGGTPPASLAVAPEPSIASDHEVPVATEVAADLATSAAASAAPETEPEPESAPGQESSPEPVPLVEDYVLPDSPPPAATAAKPAITDSLPWLDPIPYKDSSPSNPIVADDSPMPEPSPAPAPESARLSGGVERPVDDSLGILVQGSATDDLLPAQRTSKETPLASHVTSNNPMVLKSEGPTPKTLKCSECGSMNVPTEWYCERCGAELAAL